MSRYDRGDGDDGRSSGSDDGIRRGPQGGYVTSTGWRIVGERASEVIEHADSVSGGESLPLGTPDELLFATVVTARARSPSVGNVARVLLDALREDVSRSWPEVPRLLPDRDLYDRPGRFRGLEWDTHFDEGDWTGELVWRHPHPVVRGGPCTTQVIIEERRNYTRLAVRVTADEGIGSVRGMVGAGQARPSFLDRVRDRLELIFQGREVAPRSFGALDVEDLVQSLLTSESRRIPIAVLSPLEEGGFALDPDDLAAELTGIAHLHVMDEHRTTFRLTDTLGDRQLSCFFGALRIYLPGFTPQDEPREHPLLVHDRLVDPVMRAAEFGSLGVRMGRRVEMPERVRERRRDEAGEGDREDPVRPSDSTPARGSPQGDALAPSEQPRSGEVHSGVAAAAGDQGPDGHEGEPSGEGKRGGEGEPAGENAPAVQRAHSGMSGSEARPIDTEPLVEPIERMVRSVETLAAVMRELVESQRALLGEQRAVTDELEQLRTVTSVRAAGTSSLERRLGAVEDLLQRYLRPQVEAEEERRWREFPEPEAPAGASSDEPEDEERLDVLTAVRQAEERHPETLLFLDAAKDSAAESLYENAEAVGTILDAMARIARRRANGDLEGPLREAFRELGIDYRQGIAKSTPRKLREQYLIPGPEGEVYECVEHIALGVSFDPRFCLRIYFTSRAPSEVRFVIGHVGRHFKLGSTT